MDPERGRFTFGVSLGRDEKGQLVSTSGGIAPRWRADGKELYYIAPDGSLMAVPITAQGSEIGAGIPVKMFTPPIIGGGAPLRAAVPRRTRRSFPVNVTTGDAPDPIHLILNWPGLKQ
jgi:hypothetical protein